jgi:cell division protease FtsH
MSDDNKGPKNNPWVKSLLIWAGILLGLVLFVQMIDGGRSAAREGMSYSNSSTRLRTAASKASSSGKDAIRGRLSNDHQFETATTIGMDPQLTNRLRENNVTFSAQPEQQTSIWMLLLYQSLPFLLILGVAFFVMRQMQKNAGSGAMGFGRSKAKLLTEKHGKVTFDDVAGIDEAREELEEIVQF